nr:hypothetical protein DBT41_11730 [Aerococcus urinae]
MQLFDSKTANGSSAVIDWAGHDGLFSVWGTWDGATVALQYSPNGTSWIDVGSPSTLTADGVVKFSIKGGKIRATLRNAGAQTSLSAQV